MRIVCTLAAAAGLMTAAHAGTAGPARFPATAPAPLVGSVATRPVAPGAAGRRAFCAEWGARRPYVSLSSENRRCRARRRGHDG